jgi:hypothetical protein
MAAEKGRKSKPKKDRESVPGRLVWPRLVATGLVAVATITTATSADNHARNVTAGDPATCVVLRATP